MLKPEGIARWDPTARAGAVAVRRKGRHDMQSVSDLADIVMDWARYQNVAASVDNVETSKVRGTYDWRAYLQEEAAVAKEREAARTRQRDKKVPPATTPAAPNSLYA